MLPLGDGQVLLLVGSAVRLLLGQAVLQVGDLLLVLHGRGLVHLLLLFQLVGDLLELVPRLNGP